MSSTFHGSRKYDLGPLNTRPRSTTLRTISTKKIALKTLSVTPRMTDCCELGSFSGLSTARRMLPTKMMARIMCSKYGLRLMAWHVRRTTLDPLNSPSDRFESYTTTSCFAGASIDRLVFDGPCERLSADGCLKRTPTGAAATDTGAIALETARALAVTVLLDATSLPFDEALGSTAGGPDATTCVSLAFLSTASARRGFDELLGSTGCGPRLTWSCTAFGCTGATFGVVARTSTSGAMSAPSS